MNNEPAFPTLSREWRVDEGPLEGNTGFEYVSPGMSLRDYFASKAMEGMIAAHFNGDDEHVAARLSSDLSFSGGWRGRIAVASYAMANAMIEARELIQ